MSSAAEEPREVQIYQLDDDARNAGNIMDLRPRPERITPGAETAPKDSSVTALALLLASRKNAVEPTDPEESVPLSSEQTPETPTPKTPAVVKELTPSPSESDNSLPPASSVTKLTPPGNATPPVEG